MNVGFGGKHEEKEHELYIPTGNLHLPSVQCREREYFLMFRTHNIEREAHGGR